MSISYGKTTTSESSTSSFFSPNLIFRIAVLKYCIADAYLDAASFLASSFACNCLAMVVSNSFIFISALFSFIWVSKSRPLYTRQNGINEDYIESCYSCTWRVDCTFLNRFIISSKNCFSSSPIFICICNISLVCCRCLIQYICSMIWSLK